MFVFVKLRVTTHLENMEKSGNWIVVCEKSGKMEKVREKSGKVIITILQLHKKDIIAFLRYQSRQLNRRQAPASPAPQTYRRRRSTGVIDVDNT